MFLQNEKNISPLNNINYFENDQHKCVPYYKNGYNNTNDY